MEFSWLEDLGEAVLDVGKMAAVDKYVDKPQEKKQPLTVATPSAYEYQQKSIAVNNNGAPVQTVTTTFMSKDSMLLVGGAVAVLIVVLLAIKR